MIRKLLALGVGVTVAVTSGLADEEPQARADALSLTLTPLTKEIAPYEPLPMIVAIRNQSRRPVSFNPNWFHRLDYFCADEAGAFTRCAYGKDYGRIASYSPIALAPKSSKGREELLFWRPPERFDGEAFVFSRPGRYKVKVKTDGLESNVVEIVVRPASAEESAAAKVFTRPRIARFIQGMWSLSDEAVKTAAELSRLAVKHARSPFADYAQYKLGQFYYDRFRRTRNPAWGMDAYRRFSAVSGRIPALRTRAACYRAFLFGAIPASEANEEFFALKDLLRTSKTSHGRFLEWPYSMEGARENLRAMEVRYVKDDRLNKMIEHPFVESRPLGDTLKQVSRQSGVPLDTDPQFKGITIRVSHQGPCTLREFMMQNWGGFRDYWEQRGDGYYLVIERKPGKKRGHATF